ncbi:hypothetical protein GCM10010156_55340 [Planobispora rosea]|uniref:Uncharacterized protein n=1 Tax=Planobispora rosea TaxID=35762 RepID=A0A8J3SBE6_PLARO|nr:hypothetical protein [Planobispora rosea]GGS89850.1 hypothetical protein GCM10010156_55340 [Planobispora rosea]GIH86728.1 hypothetical protein Pro02_51360 [Planobispora rosea]
MAQNCECRVTLEDVAEKAGFLPVAAVAHQAKGLGLDVRADWAGRPSVAIADAGRLYDAVTGSADEANRANADRLRAEEQATAAREAAEREIFDGAYFAAVRSGKPAPKAYSDAGEAVRHARTVGTLGKIADAAKKAAGIR